MGGEGQRGWTEGVGGVQAWGGGDLRRGHSTASGVVLAQDPQRPRLIRLAADSLGNYAL